MSVAVDKDLIDVEPLQVIAVTHPGEILGRPKDPCA